MLQLLQAFVILSSFLLCKSADESILCTSSVCDEAVCSNLPERCQVQNSTHNGIFLPSPEICNCCDFCLANLNEGEQCSTGDPSNPTHSSVCGPGLFCQLDSDSEYDGFCTRINTECHAKQNSYDTRRKEGFLGLMETRPSCDENGEYAPYNCIPGQTCYCLSKNGSRIFGEADYTGLPSYHMQCACSRYYEKAVEMLGVQPNPSQHFRCAANGDFDTIQCIGDNCLCVDAADGAPTYPTQSLVNISNISNKTLNCSEITETNNNYYKKCEAEFMQKLFELKDIKEANIDYVIGLTFPTCDLDGSYSAVQENSTHKICVDKEGGILATVHKIEQVSLANTMDCKCLRANLVTTSTEKMTCLANGNYSPIQCRRGTCRCVDSNGNQVCSSTNCEEDESQQEALNC